MAKNFKWDYKAAREILLKSEEITAVCEREAEKRTRATGVDYVADVYMGTTRVNAGGYGKVKNVGDQDKKICPQCGKWHPNCDCKV